MCERLLAGRAGISATGCIVCVHVLLSAGRRPVGLEPILGALPIGVGKQPQDVHLVDLGKRGEQIVCYCKIMWACVAGMETCIARGSEVGCSLYSTT